MLVYCRYGEKGRRNSHKDREKKKGVCVCVGGGGVSVVMAISCFNVQSFNSKTGLAMSPRCSLTTNYKM